MAGTAASLLTRGPQLQLEAGTTLRLSLDRAVTVRERDSMDQDRVAVDDLVPYLRDRLA